MVPGLAPLIVADRGTRTDVSTLPCACCRAPVHVGCCNILLPVYCSEACRSTATEEHDTFRVRANDAFDVRKVAAYRREHKARFKPAPALIDPVLLAALVDVVGAAKDCVTDPRDETGYSTLIKAITHLESLA